MTPSKISLIGTPEIDGWYQAVPNTVSGLARLIGKRRAIIDGAMNTTPENATWLDWWWWDGKDWLKSPKGVKASCQDMTWFGVER